MSQEDTFLKTLVEQDDITWQSMLLELVNDGSMDPWDIDLGVLSSNFIKILNEMKETNLKISGKVILASTIMLRLKSGRFIDTDLARLESLISSMNDTDDEFDDGEEQTYLEGGVRRNYKIYPRSPQPRKRKVSVYDLVRALEGVIEKQKIRVQKRKPQTEMEYHTKNVDMNIVLREVFDSLYNRVEATKSTQMKFSDIVPSNERGDIVATFLPLLHLTNQRVTDLHQDEAFSDFNINVIKEGLSFEDLGKIEEEE
jgi:chromatin segregation and condensation protein Rec8/ScpA/Scc1 (kleisin family)